MERKPVVLDQFSIHQQARNRTPLPKATVTLRRPKPLPKPPGKPSLLNMLPMMGMALMMGLGGFLFSSGSTGSARAVWTVAPIGVMVMLTTFVQQYNHRRAVAAWQAEVGELERNYRTHLTQIGEELENHADAQRTILSQENPPFDTLVKRAVSRAGMLWERQPTDDDFLGGRIGTATLPICVDIKTLEEDDDPRIMAAREYVDARRLVANLPVTVNLNKLGSAGIRGRRIESLYLAFHIIANLVVHHSPDDVHLYVISHRSDAPDLWDWARWLPHTAALRGAPPRISLRRETDEAVLDALAQQLRKREEQRRDRQNRRGESAPHLVVVFDQAPDLMGHQVIQLLLEHEPSHEENRLRAAGLFIDAPIPHQVNVMIASEDRQLSYRETWMSNAEQVHIAGQAELANVRDMERLARALAPLYTEAGLNAGKGALPGNVRLVELLGVTNPRDIRLETLYPRDYDPHRIMRFPVGLNTDLKPLDLNMGGEIPHGMLAGTTGTGKSVLLQAMVLSLALTHPPTHVNFVLADFKGGASELAKLRDLPHVVGFVTDLDAPLVERFRIALESEVERRKRLFESSKEQSGIAVANIRAYNQLHPDDLLPHLLVLLDEFAHGRQINPDFQKTMDTVAAQGRALGMHLILSTQRATDFDQKLRANIGLRLSLRVANMEESKAIFSREEAFTSLTRPGQAYVQVGDNKIWEMFQAGRADLPFHADQTRNIDLLDDFAIYRVEPDGRSREIYLHQTSESKKVQHSQHSEAEVLVDRVVDYCREHYPPSRIICLPALPEAGEMPLLPHLSRLPTHARWDQGIWSEPDPNERLRLPIGLADIPSAQDQRPYILDLSERDGNYAVIGPAGSGKLLFLQSLLLGLAATHSPADLHFYVLAQGAPLAVFEEMPHCGAIIQTSEAERVRRLIKFLTATVESRRKALKQAKVPDMAGLRENPGAAYPAIVVVIEDYPGFKVDYLEQVDVLNKLASSGKSVDIHLVLGGASLTGFHKVLQDNLRNRLALSGADLFEVHGRRGVPLPEIKGRGYVIADQEMLVCQIAAPARHIGIQPESGPATEEIRSIARLMDASWAGPRPVEIRSLPTHIRLADLWDAAPAALPSRDLPIAPVGMDYDDLGLLTPELRRLDPVSMAIGPTHSGKTEYLMAMALAAARAVPPDELEILVIAPRPGNLHGLRALPHARLAATTAEAQAVLQAAVDRRQPDSPGESGAPAPHLLLLIDDAARLMKDDTLPRLVDRCLALSRESCINIILADSGSNLAQMKNQAATWSFINQAFRRQRGVAFSLEINELTPLNLQYLFKPAQKAIHEQHFGQGRGVIAFGDGNPVVQFGAVARHDADESEYQEDLAALIARITTQWPEQGVPAANQEDLS